MIATASPTIKLPFEDYQAVEAQLFAADKRFSYHNELFKSKTECDKLNLADLVLELPSVKLAIPPFLYTQNLIDDPNHFKCLVLIEQNMEGAPSKDSISTVQDGPDYLTNNGYILGAPVLQSFALLLDFNKNQIGFGQKVNSFGARVVQGKNVPSD